MRARTAKAAGWPSRAASWSGMVPKASIKRAAMLAASTGSSCAVALYTERASSLRRPCARAWAADDRLPRADQ